MEKFKTISQNANGQIEEKKSKFIANIFYIENIDEVENFIKETRKKYFDAKHHCYAYRLKEDDGIKEKSSDDGEPSGTAGAPIMNILKKNELLNVLVIVTRYFGGTLLGTGGLVRAYSDATLKALENTQIVMKEQGEEIEITIDYKDLEKLKYDCEKNDIEIKNIIYEKNIKCVLKMGEKEKQKIINIQEKTKNVDYKILGKCYIIKNAENK